MAAKNANKNDAQKNPVLAFLTKDISGGRDPRMKQKGGKAQANGKAKSGISPRDRKLVSIVGSLIVVVAFVYFAIIPGINEHTELAKQDETLATQVANAKDTAATTLLKTQAANNFASVESTLSGFYGVMDAAQVDQLITQIATRYGATVYKFNVVLPTTGTYAQVNAYSPTTSGTSKSTSSTSSSKSSANGKGLTGIYDNAVEVSFHGDRASLQNIVDGLSSNEYPGILIDSLEWSSYSTSIVVENSDSWLLTMNLSIYSYSTGSEA